MRALTPIVGRYDLKIKRGDTLSVTMTFRDGTTNLPIVLTGCTFLSQIRQSADAETVIAPLVINAVDLAAGTVEVHLDPVSSAGLPAASIHRAVWDLQVTFPGGLVRTMVEGAVELSGDVSRP